MNKLRIVLVDDHRLVRAGIRSLLSETPDFKVVGEGECGEDAVRLAKALAPDVLLLDLAMPGMNWMEAMQQIGRLGDPPRIIILSMHTSDEHVQRALNLKAAGYVVKNAAPDELELAIRAAMDGGIWLSPLVTGRVVSGYLKQAGAPASKHLTERQCEIVKMIGDGRSTREIAESLGLSIKTVESHRAQIMDRLNIQDAAGLIRYAIRHGISEL